MTLCTDLTRVKHDGPVILAEPLRCRRWTCDHCGIDRRRDLKRLALDGEADTFITLTVNPARHESKDARARALKRAWTRARRAACRRYGYDAIPFLAVFERHKSGEPHMHILARCRWIDWRWLSDFMAEAVGAPHVDIRRVTSQALAAYYVTKYMSKDPHKFDGCKRYWRSQDWRLAPAEADDEDDDRAAGWQVYNQTWPDYLGVMAVRGWQIETTGERAVLSEPWRGQSP